MSDPAAILASRTKEVEMQKILVVSALVVALWSPGLAQAQGLGVQFLNFEAPAHKPIAVVDVAGTDYLLVANGPDNSVEVYDTGQHNFLLRVPVGQRPVTLAVRPTPTPAGGREIYVANWLGNSITVFELEPASPGPLSFRLTRTTLVGDEPVGIAFLPENPSDPNTLPGGILHETVFVTFSAPATWGAFQPGTLIPIVNALELLDLASTPVRSVRDPRAILFAPPPRQAGPYNDQMWILNFRGGNDPEYDFDLWGSNNVVNAASTQAANLPTHGGLGTTNFNMAFAPNGELWVVGIRARNKDLPSFVDSLGETFHLAQTANETGFAVSFVARHKNPASAAVQPEVLDLNDALQGTVSPPVQASRPVTQPTDVVVYGSGDNPGVPDEIPLPSPDDQPVPRPAPTRIFVTGMSSDTIAAIEPTSSGPSTWRVLRVDVVDPLNPFALANTVGVMRGPRGLALKASGTPNDPNDRLYVYNRLSNSVTLVDPNFTAAPQAILGHFALAGQVEPSHVAAGRKFMYSSKLSAGGNVSCATCHIDGNTDFLAWNLSDGNAVPDPLNPGNETPLPGALGPNAPIKGPMVTQPLRGLVNFEVADNTVQDLLYSNRPYHWRADKGFLEQFNAAFVNLMGLPDISVNPPNGGFHMGITSADMIAYRDFVFSIHYPPNPLQPTTRTSTGSLFDEANPPQTPAQEAAQINDRNAGSGGQLGLKLFHILNTDGVACSICHALPEGSNNLLTDAFFHSESTILQAQLLETAQLKAMVPKERRLIRWDGTAFQRIPSAANQAVSHEFGLIHTGENTATGSPGGPPLLAPIADTVNDFVSFFGALTPPEQDAVSLYVREFDTGVAPLAGVSGSVNVTEFGGNPVGLTAAVNAFEQQAERANSGLAVHARINGVLRGFWYDVTQRLYLEETQTGVPPLGSQTSAQMLAFVDPQSNPDPTNLLTYHATPLGSQRRVARIQGGLAAPLSGTAPQAVTLRDSPTMTANVDVPRMTLEWADRILDPSGNAILDFFVPGRTNAASVALFQLSLVNHAPGGYGITQLRHEAPRRFRVQGNGILEGAFLRIFPPTTNDILSAPVLGQPPTTVPTAASHPFHFLLPIYPARDAADQVVWETATELAPEILLFFMNGGLASTWAVNAITQPINPAFLTGSQFTLQTTDLMLPTLTNYHYVQVENVTSTGVQVSPGSWQRITVTP